MIDMFAEHNQSIQKYYEERAKDYDNQKSRTWASKQGFSSRIINSVLNSLTNILDGPILEVGVGNGRIALPILNTKKVKFIGLDLSWEMLNFANEKLSKYTNNHSITLGCGQVIPIKNSVLSGLVCISVFHYFLSAKTVLSEFSRLLKEGGVYVYGDLTLHEKDINGFLNRFERSISYTHAKYYTPTEMKSLIEESGIKVDSIETIPYQKSYSALIQDKAQYFGVSPSILYEMITSATEEEKELYNLENNQMTLFFTLMKGTLK